MSKFLKSEQTSKSRSYDGPLSVAEAAYDAMKGMRDRGDYALDAGAHVMPVFDEYYIIPARDRAAVAVFLIKAMAQLAPQLDDKETFILSVASDVACIIYHAGLKPR